METVCFERKAFEEFAMKIERFINGNIIKIAL